MSLEDTIKGTSAAASNGGADERQKTDKSVKPKPPPQPVLILGLGNPGPEYEKTRHNLGAMAALELAARHGIGLSRGGLRARQFNSLWGKGLIKGRKTLIALPQTYMNRSGQAAAAFGSYFELGPGHLVVVHDDLDLELGRLKVARRGGAAGHKGVLSITQAMGTDRFMRLKLGIGRPRHHEAIENYVLEAFYADQHELVQQVVDWAAACLEAIIESGPEAAMQKFHRVSRNGG